MRKQLTFLAISTAVAFGTSAKEAAVVLVETGAMSAAHVRRHKSQLRRSRIRRDVHHRNSHQAKVDRGAIAAVATARTLQTLFALEAVSTRAVEVVAHVVASGSVPARIRVATVGVQLAELALVASVASALRPVRGAGAFAVLVARLRRAMVKRTFAELAAEADWTRAFDPRDCFLTRSAVLALASTQNGRVGTLAAATFALVIAVCVAGASGQFQTAVFLRQAFLQVDVASWSDPS